MSECLRLAERSISRLFPRRSPLAEITMRTGFVIEFNIRGEDGRTFADQVISSKQFGQQEFNDLTANDCPSVSIDKDIEGHNHYGAVKYDRCFVVVP